MAGGVIRLPGDTWSATAGIGADLTAGLLTYPGFPASLEDGKNRGRGEVRAGVWGTMTPGIRRCSR